MHIYKRWIKEEKKWIGSYRKKKICNVCFKIIPIVLIGLGIFFGVVMAFNEKRMEAFWEGTIRGLVIGQPVIVFYLFILWFVLSPRTYLWLIQQNIEELGLTESEQEMLALELLQALQTSKNVMKFEMIDPKGNRVPARFIVTYHFAFLESALPYIVLVRLSDIAFIQAREEEKTKIQYGTKINHHYSFTLYTIGFYKKERQYFGVSEEKLPDIAMGFFDREIRNQVLEKLENTETMFIEI